MTAHRDKFLFNKTNIRTEFQFYWYYGSTCFGQPFCPSSGVLSRTSALVHFMQNSWWWAERLPETCRVVIPITLDFSASVGFIHKEHVTKYMTENDTIYGCQEFLMKSYWNSRSESVHLWFISRNSHSWFRSSNRIYSVKGFLSFLSSSWRAPAWWLMPWPLPSVPFSTHYLLIRYYLLGKYMIAVNFFLFSDRFVLLFQQSIYARSIMCIHFLCEQLTNVIS